MQIYDKAKYHVEGEYPADLPPQQASVHTGMFLGWLVDHSLLGGDFANDFAGDISEFRRRKITGPQLYTRSGGVLDESMLNPEGNHFASVYFDFDNGKFIDDYEEVLVQELPSFYHVQDSWNNYSKLCERLDERYSEWKRDGVI